MRHSDVFGVVKAFFVGAALGLGWCMMFVLALALLAWFLSGAAQGAETELDACRRLAGKYEAAEEVRLWDGTRCDLLTDEEAIEVEWAAKHYEAPAQAVWYAMNLDRRPAVILLVKDWEAERRHIYRCTAICAKLGIKLYLEPSERDP